jgi:hypothetical protein
MEDINLVMKIIDRKPIGVITTGRPKNRWRDEVITGELEPNRQRHNRLK